jgi:hypothetical protein
MNDKPRKQRRKEIKIEELDRMQVDDMEELIRKEAQRLEQIVIRAIMKSRQRS